MKLKTNFALNKNVNRNKLLSINIVSNLCERPYPTNRETICYIEESYLTKFNKKINLIY